MKTLQTACELSKKMGDFSEYCEALISFLEEREAALINWGCLDSSFYVGGVPDLIETAGSSTLLENTLNCETLFGKTHQEIIEHLIDTNNLFSIPTDTDFFRTRFGEGMRLLGRLRQRFSENDWCSAKTLVADMQVYLSDRMAPKFDVTLDNVKETLRINDPNSLVAKALDSLLGDLNGVAEYQARSFQNIYSNYPKTEHSTGFSGTVICAGTGFGKTKSFYTPAFLSVVEDIEKNANPYTKVLAIYPRNVLLADQLSEAISQAGQLTKLLKQRGLRQITFGALLGDTPYKAERFAKPWRAVGELGHICPFIKSTKTEQKADLIWKREDQAKNIHQLFRMSDSGAELEIPSGIINLTRESISKSPPDFLFLSLEMLPRIMGDKSWQRALGITSRDKPRLLLLDEVHSYSELQGAQAAWIINRLKSSLGARALHVVGLSATLKSSETHLSSLTGVLTDRIKEITPQDSELTRMGQQSTILVKGDASSGASLLATTIQATMLAHRLLRPRSKIQKSSSEATRKLVHLSKVFGFTDNLDSINRWHPDNIDAERNLRLAQYRKSNNSRPRDEEIARWYEGQIWNLVEELGHDLDQASQITKTSSQDPGVDANSDVVLATASLEVGFDDPDVGIVIHHKAPKNMASFVQRRGRAGRTQYSRPSTIIVLSDFGRDRWSFQNGETLASPEINELSMPVTNPYVMRVQSAGFFMDWLGRKLNVSNPYAVFSEPKASESQVYKQAVHTLENILELGEEFLRFKKDLHHLFMHVLRLYGQENVQRDVFVNDVLWRAPSSLMMDVIPSLLKRIQTNWTSAFSSSTPFEDRSKRRPLPEFIPSNSWSDLELNEILVEFNTIGKDAETRAFLPQIIENCPGKISKRFASSQRERGYWLNGCEQFLSDQRPSQTLEISDCFNDCLLVSQVKGISILQPQVVTLKQAPNNLSPSSNAQWNWKEKIEPNGKGRALVISDKDGYFQRASKVFLHTDQNHVNICRFAKDGQYNLLLKNGSEKQGHFSIRASEQNLANVAIGSTTNVDAMQIEVDLSKINFSNDPHPKLLRRLRSLYFKKCLLDSDLLNAKANNFTLEWVWQISQSMLAATCYQQSCSMKEAQNYLRDVRQGACRRVLDSMFSTSSDETTEDNQGRLRQRLVDLYQGSTMLEIEKMEGGLSLPFSQLPKDWLLEIYLETLSEAALSASTKICTDLNDGDLDVHWHLADGKAVIYICETNPGGVGKITELITAINKQANVFERAVTLILETCDQDLLSSKIMEVLKFARTTVEGREAFSRYRTASDSTQLELSLKNISQQTQSHGIPLSKDKSRSLTLKLLRKGTSRISDRWQEKLTLAKRKIENELDLELNERVFAYLCVNSKPLRRNLTSFINDVTGVEATQRQLFSRFENFLLQSCEHSCQQCITSTDKLRFGKVLSRRLVLDYSGCANDKPPMIHCGPEWLEGLYSALKHHDVVILFVPYPQLNGVAYSLQSIVTNPVEREYFLTWPRIRKIQKHPEGWQLEICLQEGGNA